MSSDSSQRERFNRSHKQLQSLFPQLYGVLDKEGDFISLMVKSRDDGTTLAVLKEYGPDGSPLVCFGSGYGFVGAIMGLEGTISAGRWKADTPYRE